MSWWTTVGRPAVISTTANQAGIKLPAKPPVTAQIVAPARPAKAKAVSFVEKYKVALGLTAALGVLILIRMRR